MFSSIIFFVFDIPYPRLFTFLRPFPTHSVPVSFDAPQASHQSHRSSFWLWLKAALNIVYEFYMKTLIIKWKKNTFVFTKKVRKKVHGVPQSQTAALPRPQEEEETDKSKQAQTEQTKISSLFPKRGNRNTKRTEKHKNKMTHGKTYNKSPRRINHKATKSKTNTGSVEQTFLKKKTPNVCCRQLSEKQHIS